ncbi:MAG TPA: hypothetical protein VF172_11890 [Nitrososphaera sp.]
MAHDSDRLLKEFARNLKRNMPVHNPKMLAKWPPLGEVLLDHHMSKETIEDF